MSARSFFSFLTDSFFFSFDLNQDLFDLFEVDISVGLNCLAGDHRPKRKVIVLFVKFYIAPAIAGSYRWEKVCI